MTAAIHDIALPGLALYRRGKVRDTYDLGDTLLMVASDRISAFDVVLPTPIPRKGAVLTQLSAFWFGQTAGLAPNHLVTARVADFPAELRPFRDRLAGRSMIVRKADRIDVECVVRGYLAGSAWAEYQQSGSVAGHPLPPGLLQAARLPAPLFTPAIKSDTGHDVNISARELERMIGLDLARRLQDVSLHLYDVAAGFARHRGIILADTKFEFGFVAGELTVIDEILTPDSSRFWDAATYAPGHDQPSFDKQYVRDWLSGSGWDRESPPPPLPPAIVAGTTARYAEAFSRLTGAQLVEEG